MPGHGQTITAVVAAAAEDERGFATAGYELHRGIGYGAGGVFHQNDAGDVVVGGRSAIDFANLLATESEGWRHDDSCALPPRPVLRERAGVRASGFTGRAAQK